MQLLGNFCTKKAEKTRLFLNMLKKVFGCFTNNVFYLPVRHVEFFCKRFEMYAVQQPSF